MNLESKYKLSILIPVRNEGINLRIMLRILKAAVDVPHETLIIHDEPDDDCLNVVKTMKEEYPTLKTVYNQFGRGIINALKAGTSASQGEYVLIFAADEVGPVLAIDDMLALTEKGCEFISCTRYAHGGRRLGGSWIGKTLSTTANFLLHQFLGSALTDSTTGIKMFRRDLFERLNLQANPIGWAVVFEMAIKAQVLGLKLGEVPIISIDRLFGGKSTFRLGSWVREYLKWFFWGMIQLRKIPKDQKSPAVIQFNSQGVN